MISLNEAFPRNAAANCWPDYSFREMVQGIPRKLFKVVTFTNGASFDFIMTSIFLSS